MDGASCALAENKAFSNPVNTHILCFAVKRNIPEAMVSLGRLYLFGEGVLLNETKAFSLFKKASAQNNADGQFFTGLCYRDEIGVQQSLKKAAILFEKAAKQGLPRAQNALGECYEHGEGVEQDYFQAVKWYKKRQSCSSPALKPTATPVLWQENVMNTAEA